MLARPIVTLLTLVLLAGTARADMLPDPDSADAHCTLAEQCPDGVECPSGIRQDASVVQSCDDAQEAKGLRVRCHRGGNYFGTAVYCRPDARGSWSPPPPKASAGAASPPRPGRSLCGISPEPGSNAFAATGVGLVALLLLRRSRYGGNTRTSRFHGPFCPE
jgi:hypothetical protein